MSKAQIIGEAVDVYGVTWDVRERRPTAHGWLLQIGWPQGAPRGKGGRGVAVIVTQPLAEYLTKTRLRDYNLPIARTTAKRLRRDLGISWDWNAWWGARAHDLRSMTLEAFCQRHGCSMGAASQRRAAITCDAYDIHRPDQQQE